MNNDDTLSDAQCVPCQGDIDPLTGEEIEKYMKQISSAWQVVDQHHIEREFKFDNFRQALSFTNKVGEIAEFQGHHPDIFLAWGLVRVTLYTHKIDGLDTNDFIMASMIDKL